MTTATAGNDGAKKAKAPAPAPAAAPGTPVATAKEKTPVQTIKMTDGRTVDFPGKRKMQKESFEDNGKVSVRLDFVNGETRTVNLRTDMLSKYAAHGAEQKLGDEIAGVENVDDAVLAIDNLVERLNAGEWTMKRESDGIAGTSILIRALVEVSNKSVEQIKAFLKDKTQAEKMALRVSTKLKPIVDRLEAERASKSAKVDTDALLGELASA